jgi:outer membrane biosynthesis protein TonB
MQFRTASVISTGLHAAVLLWALLSFSSSPFKVTPAESLPVDLVSEKEFSELTKGIKHAPKPVEKPKPVVEKIDIPKPQPEDLKAKVAEKKEIKATQQKHEEPPPEPKPDPIAKEIKKDQKEQQVAKNEPLPPRRPPRPHKKEPKFNADKIAALLDKRDPQRNSITGAQLNSAPTLGTALGNASQLSQSELDALRARLMALWNPPVGIQNPEELVIRVRIRLGRNGRLTAPPVVLSRGNGVMFNTARDSAVRAVYRGQPFDMLKPEHYDTWKDIEVTFDPRDMFHG